jgi:hypothetical protein
MARGATKASSNVWYQARIEAAKTDEKLLTRNSAAEAMNISEDAIKDTELGIEKCMPVDKAVLFSKTYNAPQLLNHYCIHDCPIGKTQPISDEVVPIEKVTVKLMKLLNVNRLREIQNTLLDIATVSDGNITDDNRPELEKIMDYLDTVTRTVSELRTICRRATKE